MKPNNFKVNKNTSKPKDKSTDIGDDSCLIWRQPYTRTARNSNPRAQQNDEKVSNSNHRGQNKKQHK